MTAATATARRHKDNRDLMDAGIAKGQREADKWRTTLADAGVTVNEAIRRHRQGQPILAPQQRTPAFSSAGSAEVDASHVGQAVNVAITDTITGTSMRRHLTVIKLCRDFLAACGDDVNLAKSVIDDVASTL